MVEMTELGGMGGAATLRIGIDTGGTFTDIVCVDDSSGSMRVTKVASTPANPALALVRGVHAILGQCGAGVDDLAVLAHGTTVATNALLQGEIAGPASSSRRASAIFWRSPGNPCPRATAIRISG